MLVPRPPHQKAKRLMGDCRELFEPDDKLVSIVFEMTLLSTSLSSRLALPSFKYSTPILILTMMCMSLCHLTVCRCNGPPS